MKKFFIIFFYSFLIFAGLSCGKPATYLEYEVTFPSSASGLEKETTMRKSVEVIWKRLDKIGVKGKGASVYRIGENRIEVGLPPVQDLDRTVAILTQPGKLEFKMVDESISGTQLSDLVEATRSAQNIPAGFSKEVVSEMKKALQGKIPAEDEIAFEIQYDASTKKVLKEYAYLLNPQVVVSGEMLSEAKLGVSHNMPYISLQFDENGTKALENITSKNTGKRLAILVDGEVIVAPRITGTIANGLAQLTLGLRNDYDAQLRGTEDLLTVLNSGPLSSNISLREIKKSR